MFEERVRTQLQKQLFCTKSWTVSVDVRQSSMFENHTAFAVMWFFYSTETCVSLEGKDNTEL